MCSLSSLFQALGSWERKKRESERKNEGGLRRFFLARFRSSPTTESLKQATLHQKKRAEGEDEICDYPRKGCKAGYGKCSLFVLKSTHREHTLFQCAQKEHCPRRNHATHLCGDQQINYSLFTVQFIGCLHTLYCSSLRQHYYHLGILVILHLDR